MCCEPQGRGGRARPAAAVEQVDESESGQQGRATRGWRGRGEADAQPRRQTRSGKEIAAAGRLQRAELG